MQRRRPVRRRESAGRVVRATAAAADFGDDAVCRAEPEYPAVLDVCDRDRPVGPDICVVGVRELAAGRSGDAGTAVAPDEPVRAEIDLRNLVVEFLVGDDPTVVRGEERVVRIEERLTRAQVAGARVLPDDAFAW